ncbi:glycerophosphodiester phosphodiesterase [Streptomyces sp. NPDC054863]
MSFLTIGHRGVMGVEPENTLSSFLHAQQAGMDVIELDLHLSKDGGLVVMHDADVDRTTDGHGPVSAMSLAELRALDAGGGQQVPLFEEVLDAVSAPLQAEIKDVAVAQALAELMHRRGLVERVEVLSFHDEALARTSALVPGVRTALVAQFYGPEVVDRALAVGAGAVVLELQRLTQETVRRAHAEKLRVIGWVVNTAEELRLAHALELDGVTTDFPEIRRTGRFMA